MAGNKLEALQQIFNRKSKLVFFKRKNAQNTMAALSRGPRRLKHFQETQKIKLEKIYEV